MKIHIFDIDGTLTDTSPMAIQNSGYSTHAYWDLITFHFVEDKEALKEEIEQWRLEVSKLTGDAFIASSADMMQKAVQKIPHLLTEQTIVNYANIITKRFIETGVVFRGAVQFLNDRAEAGDLCILSTGSYQSGAMGFLGALVEKSFISSTALENIMVSGAVVDWDNKVLSHANVHDNKIKGINDLLSSRFGWTLEQGIVDESHDIYVYADDPDGNDFGILSLTTPDKRYVIPHQKNQATTNRLEFSRITWDQIIEENSQKTLRLSR